ncbi:MAG: hypothetical protein M3480_06945 [Verrucomicrobiota bacterium]|nr:hypothetical protein [Verrucomicrobiota bacterium]
MQRATRAGKSAGCLCQAAVGVASDRIALMVEPRQLPWPGFVYFSLGVIMFFHGWAAAGA